MDVRTENRGRPHQKWVFLRPRDGDKLFDPASGRKGREVCRKFGPKSLCLCCFFFPECSSVQIADWRSPMHTSKHGTIWHFFRALFPSTWRTLSSDALGHTQTARICLTFVLSLLVSGSSPPPICLFFMASTRLPRPQNLWTPEPRVSPLLFRPSGRNWIGRFSKTRKSI